MAASGSACTFARVLTNSLSPVPPAIRYIPTVHGHPAKPSAQRPEAAPQAMPQGRWRPMGVGPRLKFRPCLDVIEREGRDANAAAVLDLVTKQEAA